VPGILGPWSCLEDVRREGGGKAANLHRLEALGHDVPAWFCIPAGAFDGVLEGHARAGWPPSAPSEAELERHWRAADAPAALCGMIREGLLRLSLEDAHLAVRSSGLDEDSAEHSFAGQFESLLFQRGEAQLLEAVRACWISAFSARNLAYRKSAGMGSTLPQMGVIIQRMIHSESAGVAFSRNPFRITDRDCLVVESVWGQGEGLVGGELDADRFVVHRETLKAEAVLARKERARVHDPAGGTRTVEVEQGRADRPSLDRRQVQEVARLALRLEEQLGRPQDVEWAYADGRLHVLQARPITTLPPDALFDAGVNGDDPVIWDNSNIIESFSGVTTPLTFSHASRCYRRVYAQVCRVSGVPGRVVRENDALFRNMLGLVRGRVYYNLVHWYRVLGLFPLLGRSRGFMDTMMGVRQSLEPELAARFEALGAPPRYGLFRRAAVLATLLRRLAGAGRSNAAFLGRIERVCAPLEAEDLRRHSLPGLFRIYRRLEDDVLAHWTAPIVNDTRCMLAFGTLKALTERWLGGVADDGEEPGAASTAASSLGNDLLCGEGDLKSTEPARALMEIARHIERCDPAVKERFLDAAPEALQEWLDRSLDGEPGGNPARNPEGEPNREASREPDGEPELARLFRDYIRSYGFRCVDEQKLEEPDLHQQPWLAVASVQGYLRHGIPSAEALRANERAIRKDAERRARDLLRGPRRWLYFAVLGRARRAIAERERLRFERTRTFGLTRRLFRAIGSHLVSIGLLDDEADVFYLTVDELFQFHEGRGTLLDLRALAALRLREFDRYRTSPAPPDRFLTRGTAGSAFRHPALLLERDLLPAETGGDDPDVLRGTPCCPGVVEGTVRVARTFVDAAGLSGEILVTERTDPGWVPVFPACAGLVIERGSLLSHSAVVAREMGIPTIVGVGGRPLERLRTGQRVRMDAGRGEVRIL
jgi:rifampicin phosphotransferase